MRFLSLLALLVAPAAAAQDIVFDPAPVEACRSQARTDGTVRPDCIGAAANACQSATPDGFTTVGTVDCIGAETDAWDRILNDEYGALRGELDSQDASYGGQDRSDALRDAQRAWIAYRDAECGLQWAFYQGGTIRSIVAASCHLDFTASRALELADMRDRDGR